MIPPAKVQAATQAYRDEMDVFGPFIAERCVIHRDAEVRASELWAAYKAWCAENGVKEQNQNKLGRYLNAKGTRIERSNGIKRIGIGLLEKHHSDSASSGTFGTFGTFKPESPIEKASKGTFRENLPKVPNLPNSADAGLSSHHPVDLTPADDGMKEQSQHKLGRYLSMKGWRAEGTKPVKRIGIGLLDKSSSDHADNSDLDSEKSPIEPSYSDFPEKGRKGREGRNTPFSSQHFSPPSPVDCKNSANSADLGQQQPPAGDVDEGRF